MRESNSLDGQIITMDPRSNTGTFSHSLVEFPGQGAGITCAVTYPVETALSHAPHRSKENKEKGEKKGSTPRTEGCRPGGSRIHASTTDSRIIKIRIPLTLKCTPSIINPSQQPLCQVRKSVLQGCLGITTPLQFVFALFGHRIDWYTVILELTLLR